MQVPLQGHVPQFALAFAYHRAIGSVVHYHNIRTVMAPNIISIKRRILVLLNGGPVAHLETKASSIYRLCTTNHIFSLALTWWASYTGMLTTLVFRDTIATRSLMAL